MRQGQHFLLLMAWSRGGIAGALAAFREHEGTLTAEAVHKDGAAGKCWEPITITSPQTCTRVPGFGL